MRTGKLIQTILGDTRVLGPVYAAAASGRSQRYTALATQLIIADTPASTDNHVPA